MLQVIVDPDAIARYGIPTRDVLTMVEAVGNRRTGEIREGQRRFPLAVRLPDVQRTDQEALGATLLPTVAGPVVRMDQVVPDPADGLPEASRTAHIAQLAPLPAHDQHIDR